MYGTLTLILFAVVGWYLYNKFNNIAFEYVDSRINTPRKA